MKKLCGSCSVLVVLVVLIFTTTAHAFFRDGGKDPYADDQQPGLKATNHVVMDSSTPGDQQEPPVSLSKREWQRIRTSLERDRYRLSKTDRDSAYQAPNHVHDFDAVFTRQGVQVSPRQGNKAWNWGLRLSSYGYGSDLHTVSGPEKVVTRDNRIEYHRGDMVEWYINDHRGLEQGFTLKRQPSDGADRGPLQLQMATATTLLPDVEKEGKGIVFRNGQGKAVLRYSGLYAYDSTGKDLSSRMAANREGIRLIVDDRGAVYPITIDPFIETNKLTASDGAVGDQFGYSVSISGDTIIVGAHADDDSGSWSGSTYIFSRDQGGENNWGELTKLLASDGAAGDEFGYSVSISGDTAVVGAPYDDGIGSSSGSAYIFSRNQGGADNWGQVKKLLAADEEHGAQFGYSVSISNNSLIVGARSDDDNGSSSGSAYIFSRDQGGVDHWGQVKKLLASDGAAYDSFGYSVSISGSTVIVGAQGDDDYGYNSGAAYIFSRDQGGLNNWGQVKKLLASDGSNNHGVGDSVSISGDTVIIGACGDDDNGDSSGAAYIFSRNQGGANNWGQVKKLLASDGTADDSFGESVSISNDTIVVGADEDADSGEESGSAYIFSRDQGGTDNWGQVTKLLASDGAIWNLFGGSVSLSGDTVVVGAATEPGSAYVFSNNLGDSEKFPWIMIIPSLIKGSPQP